MREWTAEVIVDAALARRLIAGQFPELDAGSVRLLAEGWDNSVWVVEERWAFRFPRRAIAVPGVLREMAVLPRLAALLPLQIPTPHFRGRPADGYPWPFFGGPLLTGREASDPALSDTERAGLARPLAGFLRTLHSAAVTAAVTGVELPSDPMGRADMPARVARTTELFAEVERLGLWHPPGSVRPLLEAARTLPTPESRAIVHGDLHFRHLLVDDTAAPTGVIDWGDVCHADPRLICRSCGASCPPRAEPPFSLPTGRPATSSSCARGCWRCSSVRRWPSTRTTKPCTPSSAKRSKASPARPPTDRPRNATGTGTTSTPDAVVLGSG